MERPEEGLTVAEVRHVTTRPCTPSRASRDGGVAHRRLSRIEGAVLGPWRPEPPTEPPPAREARPEPAPASGAASPRQ